jgi:hypothetical protein
MRFAIAHHYDHLYDHHESEELSVSAKLIPTPARHFVGLWPKALTSPYLAPVALVAGIALPNLATMVFPYVALLAAVAVSAALLAAQPAAGTDLRCGIGLFLRCCLLAPALAWALGALVGADPEERGWMALVAAAPVGAVAVHGVATLGLRGSQAGTAYLVSVVAAPLLVPGVAFAAGSNLGVAPTSLAVLMLLTAGLPAAAALLLRRGMCGLARPQCRIVLSALANLAFAGLALGRGQGVLDAVLANPAGALAALALACLAALAGLLAAVAGAAASQRPEAMMAGIGRNNAIVWAACAATLPQEGHVFMVCAGALVILGPPILGTLLRHFGAGRVVGQ